MNNYIFYIAPTCIYTTLHGQILSFLINDSIVIICMMFIKLNKLITVPINGHIPTHSATYVGGYMSIVYCGIQSMTSSYNASDMCSSPATDFGYSSPGMIHRATLSG